MTNTAYNAACIKATAALKAASAACAAYGAAVAEVDAARKAPTQ